MPSEGDVSRLSGADMLFHNGLHLEARMGDVLKKMPGKVTSVAVAEAIDASKLLRRRSRVRRTRTSGST